LEQVGAIAAELTDGRLRDSFLASALVGELRTAVAATGPQARPVYPAGLSSREVQVLRLVARGDTNAAIGGALSISVKTVNAHLSSIHAKTECANRAAAPAFAQRHGLG